MLGNLKKLGSNKINVKKCLMRLLSKISRVCFKFNKVSEIINRTGLELSPTKN